MGLEVPFIGYSDNAMRYTYSKVRRNVGGGGEHFW